ncbi:hypothetical protein PAXINDRAFT_15515 [Paxillus involutus ATCC 200175]|uniref:CxC2-like cysteine cluster KDZ transposase-associated domain-containing protein n=1 Tax=Paxillus involutus ATCC 200175 TaxID=664439 RepID=A0A0C9TV30_PAXIN|nr:hypothetical protein PAXINDRAFT_15515 [Paxillus involutus ATCC 200175]
MASIQAELDSFSAFDTWHYDDAGNHLLTIVDISGIHVTAICPCKCPQQSPLRAQLLQIGIVFQVHELGVQGDRDELLQIPPKSDQSHSSPCYARPIQGIAQDQQTMEIPPKQAGVNLSEDWIEDLGGAWKYSRSFVMDGNFSAEHMKLKNNNDFALTGGTGYFTASPRYQAHLQIADDKQPKSTCHEHKAVNQVHATQKHLAATGIGAIACARHRCFVPDTVVDFQKGEQQVNMDYTLCRALRKLEGMLRAAIIYNIACQFNVHFGARVSRSDYLKFSDTIQIIWGIGLFHIHGIGKVDGKVLETLWSQLNEICGSTCSMTTMHRREVLNDHMLDSNRKKMLNIVQSLLRKYIQALQASEVAEEGY